MISYARIEHILLDEDGRLWATLYPTTGKVYCGPLSRALAIVADEGYTVTNAHGVLMELHKVGKI